MAELVTFILSTLETKYHDTAIPLQHILFQNDNRL